MITSIQGQKASFHHIALLNLLPDSEIIFRDTFEDVFKDVSEKKAAHGLIACENSIAGSISANYNRLVRYQIPIIAETYLRISHHLIAHPHCRIEDIKEIHSHPMAIEQCRNFLNNCKDIKVVEVEDTAGAVKHIQEQRLYSTAALASDLAASTYKMKILKEHVETDPQNYTRFLMLSFNEDVSDFQDSNTSFKTTLHFGVEHKSGSLLKVLNIFSDMDINMTKLESKPQLGTPWSYEFIVDLVIDIHREEGKKLLKNIKIVTTECHVLGCYRSYGNGN